MSTFQSRRIRTIRWEVWEKELSYEEDNSGFNPSSPSFVWPFIAHSLLLHKVRLKLNISLLSAPNVCMKMQKPQKATGKRCLGGLKLDPVRSLDALPLDFPSFLWRNPTKPLGKL